MIEFVKDGLEARIKITSFFNWIGDRVYTMKWNCNDSEYASLLTKRFQDTMEEKLRTIRHEAYEAGWKDAKAKKARETWFSGAW